MSILKGDPHLYCLTLKRSMKLGEQFIKDQGAASGHHQLGDMFSLLTLSYKQQATEVTAVCRNSRPGARALCALAAALVARTADLFPQFHNH